MCEQITRLVRSGSVVFDIGAHIGFTTLLFALRVGQGGRVYAFEPVEENRRLLASNLRANEVADRCTIEACAVAQETTTMTFRRSRARFAGHGSLIHRLDHSRFAELTVPVVCVDDYVARLSTAVDFVKIDVEGAEGLVVAGARRVLAALRPIVLIEVHDGPAFPRSTFVEALVDLARLQYRLYCIEDDPTLANELRPEEWRGHKHCLAMPSQLP